MACYSNVKLDNFWKFDKIDKIVISFIFIIITFLCVFNCYTFASTKLELSYLNDRWVQYSDNGTTVKIVNSKGNKLAFIRLAKGVTYNFRVDPASDFIYTFAISESPSIDVGTQLKYVRDINKNPSNNNFTYTVTSDNEYMVIYASTQKPNYDFIDITIQSSSMTSALNFLVNNVGINQIWLSFEKIIPYLSIVILVSFGVWLIKHNIIEHSKGRDF